MSKAQPNYEQLLAENKALREENWLLRQQLGLDAPNPRAESPDKETIVFTPQTKREAPHFFPNTTITRESPSDERADLFMSLFHGREDVYAKRWYSAKSGKNGYSPVCFNEWRAGLCDKRKYKCSSCPNRNLAPLNRNAILAHLRGNSPTSTDVIGIYPLTEDEYCYLLAIDFDGNHWQHDITTFRNTCSELELTSHIERSRSGNGGHAWFFFEDKISAATARKFGSALLTEAMSHNHEIKFKSYDRLFPNQDTLPSGGFGNLIALPLQGLAINSNNSLFIDENFTPYPDQWAYLACVKKLSADTIDNYINRLCDNSELGILSPSEKDGERKPWERAKPQPILTSTDFSCAVKITKANMIHIEKDGISQKALNRIKRLGAFRNPDFYKAQAMRLPTYDKPRVIDTTEETQQYLSIPRGCEDTLLSLLDSTKVKYTVDDKRNIGNPIDVEFNGALRPEQEIAAATMLQHERGILSATTAFGKTVVGSYIISRRKVNALILVHTSALLDQWAKSLSQFLTINGGQLEQRKKRGRKKNLSIIGQLGAAKNTLGGKVDVAIMQSLISNGEVKELVRDYGLVIVDECHHVSAASFESILKTVNAKYVYGLTATPARQDGQQPIIYMQCGDIHYQVDAKEQAEKSGIQRFVVPRFTSFKKPIGIEDKDFGITQIYAAIAENKPRNKLILSDILDAIKEGRTPIVLTQRSDHVALLADSLEKNTSNVIRLNWKNLCKRKKGGTGSVALHAQM